MNMNPYQSPLFDRDSLANGQSWLTSALIVVAWMVVIISSAFYFGVHGFGISLYIVACLWFIITRIDAKLMWPLNRVKPTAFDCLVVLAICGVLHGVALPAVITNCVGRRQPNTPLSTSASAPRSGDETPSVTSAETLP